LLIIYSQWRANSTRNGELGFTRNCELNHSQWRALTDKSVAALFFILTVTPNPLPNPLIHQ
jgi:hypothetical protein